VEKVDQLINLVGELVITQSMPALQQPPLPLALLAPQPPRPVRSLQAAGSESGLHQKEVDLMLEEMGNLGTLTNVQKGSNMLDVCIDGVTGSSVTLAVCTSAATAAAGTSGATTAATGAFSSAVEKVDQLINLVGELVITQSMLAQRSGELDPVAPVTLAVCTSAATAAAGTSGATTAATGAFSSGCGKRPRFASRSLKRTHRSRRLWRQKCQRQRWLLKCRRQPG
jgi:chemotaxis protein histidine kinase CheA